MCENSVNVPQLKLSVGQVDDAIALSQQWLEQLHHLADNGKQADASADIAQAGVLLGEARARLKTAIDALEGRTSSPDVTVELI